MIKISLILPFRRRHWELKKMFDSLYATTKDHSSIEVILFCDIDDEETIKERFKYYDNYPKIKIRFVFVEASNRFIEDYWNPAARLADGRFIIAINDDSVFLTKYWDEIIYSKLDKYSSEVGDDFITGYIGDGYIKDKSSSCWTIQSKKTIDFLGWFFYPEFLVWGPDGFHSKVFNKLGRAIDLSDVLIEHDSVHNKRSFDYSNNQRFEKLNMARNFDWEANKHLPIAEKIKQKINESHV